MSDRYPPPLPDNTIRHLTLLKDPEAGTGVFVMLEDSEGLEHQWEELVCRQVRDDLFEVACIPFFAYNVSFGDRLRATKTTHGNLFDSLHEASGHSTFRVWFGHSADDDHTIRHHLIGALAEISAFGEWYGMNLLAIDAGPDSLEAVLALLVEGESTGNFIYEVGDLAA